MDDTRQSAAPAANDRTRPQHAARVKTASGRWVVIGVLLALVALGNWLGRRNGGKSPQTLFVTDESADFGEVDADPGFRWVVSVRNPTATDIAIRNIRTSCACTSVEPTALVVPAGRERDLQLTLDLTPRIGELDELRPFSVVLLPELDGPEPQTLNWTVTGQVRPPAVVVNPTSLELGNFDPAATESWRFTVYAREEISEIDWTLEPALGQLTSAPIEVDTRKSLNEQDVAFVGQFELTYEPPHVETEGELRAELHLVGTARDGRRLAAMPVSIHGRVLPDVRARPDMLLLGVCEPDKPVETSVQLWSQGGDSFTIKGVDAGFYLAHCEYADGEAASVQDCRLRLGFHSPGNHQGNIDFTVQYADGRSKQIHVPLRAFVLRSAPASLSVRSN